MKTSTLAVLAMLQLIPLARAADHTVPAQSGSLKGEYDIYGGTLSEKLTPSLKDRKVAFLFKGDFARDLFNHIGPDVKKDDACSSAPGYRERRRGDVDCVYDKESGYSCYFGLDMRNGKSTYGAIC